MTALNFPANPTNGQTYENYVYDGTDGVWKRISPGGTLGNIDDVTINAPADGESLVYDSATGDWINADATVEVYGVNTAATDYFMIPVGADSDRPVTPANGYVRFNTDSGFPEWYSESSSQWVLFKDAPSFEVEYLVIAGGGGGGTGTASAGIRCGGGGGAGGYRNATSGELSGGNSSAESAVQITTGTYALTVGAGGSGGSGVAVPGTSGGTSTFYTVSSDGGGGGGRGASSNNDGLTGGSGGGGGADYTYANADGGVPSVNQGFSGGAGASNGAGAGGGAGSSGGAASPDNGGDGGNGLASSISGSSVTRAGGGGGGYDSATSGLAPGGSGGGGSGGKSGEAGSNGDAFTGSGGGGGGASEFAGGSGGSGIVIVKYPSIYTVTTTVGISSTTSTIGDYKVTQFTAGTGTVTFS